MSGGIIYREGSRFGKTEALSEEFPTSPPEHDLTYDDVQKMMAQYGNWVPITWTPELEAYADWECSYMWEDAQARKLFNILGDGAV